MLRNRNRNKVVAYSVTRGACNPTTGAFNGSTTVASSSVTDYEDFNDYVVPGFRRKSAAGAIFNNSMSKMKTSHTFKQINVWACKNGNSSGFRSNGFEIGLLPTRDPRASDGLLGLAGVPTAIDQARAIAVTEAYGRVGSADVESLTTLGELKETLGFLYSPIKKVIGLTRRARAIEEILHRDNLAYTKRLNRFNSLPEWKRRKTPGPVRKKRSLRLGKVEVSDISSVWLAYRYGLMPLIYEADGYIKALNKLASTEVRATARGKYSTTRTMDRVSPRVTFPQQGDSVDNHDHCEYIITCRAGVLYVPRLETLATKYGLEWHRIPSTLWELTWLSFVADWFLNMSEVLNALTAEMRAQEIKAAWVTTTVEWDYFNESTYTPGDRGLGGVSRFEQKGKYVTRTPVTLADVRLKTRIELNSKRVADAFALAHLLLFNRKK